MPEGNKSEKATPKKRRDERKKGHVFLSNDAVAVATLLCCFLILRVTAAGSVEQLYRYLDLCMGLALLPAGQVAGRLSVLVREGLWTLLLVAGPIMAASVAAAVAATFFQTKLLFSGEAIKPKLNRISPMQGIKKLFSLRSVVEALKGTLKIAILLVILFRFLQGVLFTLSNYLYMDLVQACGELFSQTFTMVMQVAAVFVVVAGFDFFYQWWDYERELRMTKQEVKEEYKQVEGDPQIKGKIKETQRRMAQSRMMQKVPGADVVIRNPTHVAVALRYRPETDAAPVVLAKGLDELALRIVSVAEEHGVAVLENVALARALYAGAELDRAIPPEFYGAVADVLVYLYRIDAGGSK